MFTGIIKEIGTLIEIEKRSENSAFLISSKKISPNLGESIAVNGCCLTVSAFNENGFWLELIPETLRTTNLGELEVGDGVNLESSLKVGEGLDGHFVTGHVDLTSEVIATDDEGLTINTPREYQKFVTQKGSITINGVALTVTAANKDKSSVALIPFTREHTNLGKLNKGDRVNIEIDLIARYLNKLKI